MVSGKQLPLIKDNIVIVLEGKIQALRFTSDGMNISTIMIIVIIIIIIIIISQLKIFKRIFLNIEFKTQIHIIKEEDIPFYLSYSRSSTYAFLLNLNPRNKSLPLCVT
jgi:hypothetical protein